MTLYARIRYGVATLGAYLAGGVELFRCWRMARRIARHEANYQKWIEWHDANYNNVNYRRLRK